MTLIAKPPRTSSLTIRQMGERVLLFDQDGSLIADIPWDKAEELGKALICKAASAEIAHWTSIDRFFDGGVKYRRILGMPVITSKDQMERLGNGLKNLTST